MLNTATPHPKQQIFISYKVENANVARAIAEDLISHGHGVWFAEYRIRSKDFDDDRAISSQLSDAIQESSAFVLITNDRWAASEWCQAEMRWITERSDFASRSLQVLLPPENGPKSTWPQLDAIPYVEYQRCPREVRCRLEELGLINPTNDERSSGIDQFPSPNYFDVGYGMRINLPGFRRKMVDPDWFTFHTVMSMPMEINSFIATFDGQDVRVYVEVNPFEIVRGEKLSSTKGPLDDRAVYRHYREYAREWMSTHELNEAGLHIHFFGEKSSLAVTTIGKESCERRYVVPLENDFDNNPGEAHIYFFWKRTASHAQDDLCKLARLAPILDRATNSLNRTALFSPSTLDSLLILPSIGLMLVMWWRLAVIQAAEETPIVDFRIALCMFGISTGSAILYPVSAAFRYRVSRSGVTWGPKVKFGTHFGSVFVERAWNRLVGVFLHDVSILSFNLPVVAVAFFKMPAEAPPSMFSAWVGLGILMNLVLVGLVCLVYGANRSTVLAQVNETRGGENLRSRERPS